MSWSATHRITLEPTGGGSLKHWLVMLCKDPYSQGGLVGVTEEDFRGQRSPTWRWRADDDSWWHMGRPMSLVQRGAMRVEPVKVADAKPSTLRYLRRGQGTTPSSPLIDPGAPTPRG